MDAESLVAVSELESCESGISLNSLESVPFWGLRLVVQELVPGAGPENPERDFVPELAAKIRASLIAQPRPRFFELVWRECISYTVANESYGKYPETPEVFTGKWFRKYSWSYLLELTRKTTYASDDHPGPGPLQHFCVAGCDDIVDVIACEEPVIRRVQATDETSKIEWRR